MNVDTNFERTILFDLKKTEKQFDLNYQSFKKQTDNLPSEEIKLLLQKIDILKQQKEIYQSLLDKFDKNNIISPKLIVSPTPSMDDEGLETMEKNINKEEEDENSNNIEDYIDRLNNNIEKLKKAFLKTEALEKTEEKYFEDESPIKENFQTPDSTSIKKKEKSLFDGNNLLPKQNVRFMSYHMKEKENIESLMESSTFSILSLHKKIRTLPARIQELEEENENLKIKLSEFEKISSICKNEERNFSLNERIQKVEINKEKKESHLNSVENNKEVEENILIKQNELANIENHINQAKIKLEEIKNEIIKKNDEINLKNNYLNLDNSNLGHYDEHLLNKGNKIDSKNLCS